MKKGFFIFIAFQAIVATAFADKNINLLDNYNLANFDFAAPVISNTSSVNDKQVGMIVYDLSTNQFRGLNSSGNWDYMTVPSGNPVTSSATSPEKIERATITPTSGSTCTYTQSGSWITSATPHGIGDCTINITGFASAPTCVVTAQALYAAGVSMPGAAIYDATSTTVRVLHNYVSNPTFSVTANTAPINIICMGPKS